MADNPTPELLTALCKFQQQTITAFKDSKGYGYKYASEEAINDALRPAKALGLCHTFTMHGLGTEVEGKPGQTEVVLRLFHAASGGFLESSMNVDDYDPNNKKDARHQQRGSGISYARRYLLAAVAGLATSENEGETTLPPDTSGKKSQGSPKPPSDPPAQSTADTSDAAGELQDMRGIVSAALLGIYKEDNTVHTKWVEALKAKFSTIGAKSPKVEVLNMEQLLFSQDFITNYKIVKPAPQK
jgi:hypothetical protein